MKIILSDSFLNDQIYFVVDRNHEYIEAEEEYQIALKSGDTGKIDDSVNGKEAVARKKSYSIGFHDGMRFILDALAGKDVLKYE